jgi:NAD(P)-dependent dehydrogenase (short-subunit alcohol dehydrogenase family)
MTTIHATMTEPKSSRTAATATGAILVSGAGGEMGHALLDAFAKRYHGSREIIAMDVRELPKDRAAHATKAYACDVSDPAAIDEICQKHDVSEVWHLAALLSTRGERSPELALKVNVMGSANLLKLAADSAARRGTPVKFMFPSTIAIYGVPTLAQKCAAGRVTEDQCLEPITMYGAPSRRWAATTRATTACSPPTAPSARSTSARSASRASSRPTPSPRAAPATTAPRCCTPPRRASPTPASCAPTPASRS